MGDLICVNATFPEDWMKIYRQYGVVIPEMDKIYSVREVVKHTTGDTGVRLNEIINPPFPIPHPILGKIDGEITFNIKRFRKLDGSEISREEIQQSIKQKA